IGMHHESAYGCAQGEWEETGLWRARGGGRKAGSAEERGDKTQGTKRVALHRKRHGELRPERHVHRQSGVWAGYAHGRNALCERGASAGAWEFGEIARRQSGPERRRREANGNDRCVQAPRRLSGTRWRSGAGGQHLGGNAGKEKAEDRVGEEPAQRLELGRV